MEQIREELRQAIKDLYNLDDFDLDLTPSPDNIDADYSTNAPLKLAKTLHKSPMQIAEDLENYLSARDPIARAGGAHRGTPKMFCEAKILGEDARQDLPEESGTRAIMITPPGFLNFTLPDDYLSDCIDNVYSDFAAETKSTEYSGKTVICEFSDPNPFKILHVGHLYTSVVGDAISRLYEYAGAKVIRANFGGDVGLHVAKTMYALLQKPTDDLKIEDIATCYIEGTAAYDEDEHAHEEITKLNKEIYNINAKGIHGRATSVRDARQDPLRAGRTRPEDRLAELYWKGRALSYDYFNAFYARIGVHFDKYYPESTVAALGLATVEEQLKNGVYEKSDGAVIFDGDKYGLHTRVFINKEGVPTYEAKDVGLIFTKWQDYHFDKSVVITGAEQLDYMKVVLKSVEQYAPDLVEKTTHLTHGLVKLPGGVKMSSRKGNFLKAVDVLALIDEALATEYGSKDPKVSLAATKYAFLKYKMGGDIIFDPHESVKMTGNSGPYLLYSAVRAKKILTKSGSAKLDPPEAGRTRAEHNLAKKLLEYKSVLGDAVRELAPHKLANYLYELAQSFSRFYEACPVAGSEQETERRKLVQVYLDTMTHGLNLLGIEIPEEM